MFPFRDIESLHLVIFLIFLNKLVIFFICILYISQTYYIWGCYSKLDFFAILSAFLLIYVVISCLANCLINSNSSFVSCGFFPRKEDQLSLLLKYFGYYFVFSSNYSDQTLQKTKSGILYVSIFVLILQVKLMPLTK